MTGFLDELARSMATPVPRRRAMRLLGGALVALAWPVAAASGARATHDCPSENAFLCACPNKDLFYKICCPNETDTYRYECRCKAPPEGYAQCYRIDKPLCGPDITDALLDALSRIKSAFAGWSGPKRYAACSSLVTVPAAAFSWDIRELGPGGRAAFSKQHSGCSKCGFSVQVGNGCHYSGSVNYAAYGVMMRVCRDYLSKEDSSIADWFTQQEMLEMIYIHKNQTGTQAANFQASNEWALAGYNNSGSLRPTPPGDRKECQPRCPTSYSGPGLTVNWLPFVIRPN
jgi:hypothetical protein